MRKEPKLPSLPWGDSLRAEIGRGKVLGWGVGDKVVVGLGSTGGCKGQSDAGGVIREGERERGGQKEWYGKKTK